jgi:hypothetical protein
MRFAHRRRNEGGVSRQEGGFFRIPPQTPPPENEPKCSGLDSEKGELGDFSFPLHVGGQYPARRSGYGDHRPGARAICTATPPAPPISAAKSLHQHENEPGGVCGETPPTPMFDPLDRIADLPVEVVAGLKALLARSAPRIERPAAWRRIVNDALALAISGTARRALDHGWDVADVFGVGERDSNEFEGLAVWLGGREVVEMGEWKARTACGAIFYREAFGRPHSPRLPNVPLWRFGMSHAVAASPQSSGPNRRAA